MTMNAIVVNTLSGAVSEYTFMFQSATPTHAGSATGLFELVGETDGGLPIASRVLTGKPEWGGSLKMLMDKMFFGLKGVGSFNAIVAGEATEYSYAFTAAASGESRAQPGKGIRENYLAFGFTNPSGQDFQLDSIEVATAKSKTRRV
jgi:hypothetical protein